MKESYLLRAVAKRSEAGAIIKRSAVAKRSEAGAIIKRRICVVTGSRAEYGHLYWVMREIAGDPALQLQVVLTGAHLSPEFGLTGQEVARDGFPIAGQVEMLLSADTPTAIAKSLGLGIIGFADLLDRLQPDLLLLLGDRFEMLAAAQTALIARIPVAHLHGGERSEGAMDEAIRHAITKMAHWHFVAATAYRQRVIQLGEDPARVFLVGAPGLDHLTRTRLLDRTELEESIGFPLGNNNFLVTYHPVTLESQDPTIPFQALLQALDRFPEARIVFTLANADTLGRGINQMLTEYVAQHATRCLAVASLGTVRYLSLLQQVDMVIGNSSSGLIEAPLCRTATVNLGDRQRGRLKADSIIDVPEETEAIAAAIHQALTPEFRERVRNTVSLYGQGDAARNMVKILRDLPLDGLLKKSFHDLGPPDAAIHPT